MFTDGVDYKFINSCQGGKDIICLAPSALYFCFQDQGLIFGGVVYGWVTNLQKDCL